MHLHRLPIYKFLQRHACRLRLALALAAAGTLVMLLIIPPEIESVRQQLMGFPDSHVATQKARPWVLAMICLLPALGAWLYTFGDTLDRYISRRFLTMFGICLSALYAIWLLIDLSDNMGDFTKSASLLETVSTYYMTRLPAVLMLLLPYALLLSLLESLGKLSTNREIIAIIQAGRSVLRLSIPLIVAGGLCTLFAGGLNYHWAPIAEGTERDILAEAAGQKANDASKVLYRNLQTERLWMVSAFPNDYEKGRPLLGVEVTSTSKGKLESRVTAKSATWNAANGEWTFQQPVICHYEPGKPPIYDIPEGPLVIDSWSETPWQIIKPGLSAEHLGIPDLNAWLNTHEQHPQIADPAPYRTQWHYRLALPFTCLITVLLAAPLAIHFSRLGAGGGIFLAIALSCMMLLINTIILAFGESGHLPPMLAAWLPNLIFALIGAQLLHRRITGRPIYDSLRKLVSPA